MKTVQLALTALGFLCGAVFLVYWILGWTGRVPVGKAVATSLGAMLLAFGLLSLFEAASKSADRGWWGAKGRRSNVRVGRLSAFAFGVGFCSIAAVFLGYDRMPEWFGISMAAVFMVSWGLAWLGGSMDRRRARAENAPQESDGQDAGTVPR